MEKDLQWFHDGQPGLVSVAPLRDINILLNLRTVHISKQTNKLVKASKIFDNFWLKWQTKINSLSNARKKQCFGTRPFHH